MKNKNRGILLIILAVICMLVGTTVSAESVVNEDGIENIVYSDENSSQAIAELILMNPNESDISLYGQYLSYGIASIDNLGGGQVNFYGDTICYRDSDIVVVALSLQRLVGGSWRTYTTITDTSYNTWTASAGTTVTVPRGYSYRVKGVHTAQKGSTVESATTYTRDVYIG
ncbi:MAG TPA: hypothetical protein IAB44_00460 [Candidatus Limivivens intestinipullorum]|uniref:Uncharacterized protein n=1 Tax=Candidatus Limivivens intestinipullorum TaxID=2840858 RepID=A0A9D1EQB5_9FIRM|nr:hypothetical protein [Candidatus Limivivens intestinipullorum]